MKSINIELTTKIQNLTDKKLICETLKYKLHTYENSYVELTDLNRKLKEKEINEVF